MACDVEFTEEFEVWWDELDSAEQDSVAFSVRLLAEHGIGLKRPHADTVKGSAYPNMRELRCQHRGRPLRVLYAFDPRRTAILLLGGDKTGNARWYDQSIPRADRVYAMHLKQLNDVDG